MVKAKTYKPAKGGKIMLDVLRHVGKLTHPTSATDIAAGLRLPIGTIMGYLVVLEDENFCQRTGGLYEPTSEFAKIWSDRKLTLQRRIGNTEKELKEIE